MNRWLPVLLLAAGAVRGETGSAVCAGCHRAIFETYQATGMARSSGAVTAIETEGRFAHSGTGYQVYRQGGASWFGFETAGVQGARRLEYFVDRERWGGVICTR